jgi:hypothetical protein
MLKYPRAVFVKRDRISSAEAPALRSGPVGPVLNDGALGSAHGYVQSRSAHEVMNSHSEKRASGCERSFIVQLNARC